MSSGTLRDAGADARPVDGRESEGRLPSVATLELAADDTRLRILRALWTAEDTPLGFSRLRERAGVERSSRFNYHLQELVGVGVRATDDGYDLSARGERFLRALSAVPSLDRPADGSRTG